VSPSFSLPSTYSAPHTLLCEHSCSEDRSSGNGLDHQLPRFYQPTKQPTSTRAQSQQPTYNIMCYQVVEVYAACGCLYYMHAVDMCANYGRRGHAVTQKTIRVGYACSDHSRGHSGYSYTQPEYSDSGYHSGHSHRDSSSRGQYR
jgi:hypothetical protein